MAKGQLVQGQYHPKNTHKYVGKYPITFRSSWELRLMKFFDENANVLQWTSESISIPYYDPIKKKMRRYFPDFSVVYMDKEKNIVKEIIEVKPLKHSPVGDGIVTNESFARASLKVPMQGKKKLKTYMREMATYITNIKKWEAMVLAAHKMGYRFRVMTESSLFRK